MQIVTFESFKKFFTLFLILFLITFPFIIYIKGVKENFTTYSGVNRWNNNIYSKWKGGEIYPVNINCSCPDNYDLIDTKCVNRNYPFNSINLDCNNMY